MERHEDEDQEQRHDRADIDTPHVKLRLARTAPPS